MTYEFWSPPVILRSLLLATALIGVGALTTGCANRGGFYGAGDVRAEAAPAPSMVALPRDVHSFARPEVARVHHVDLDLRTDFEARRLFGRAALDILTAPGATEIVLDTRDLVIRSVTDAAGQPLQYALGADAGVRGRPLTVQIPAGTKRVVVDYATSPDAAALQWLTPAQTAGKKRPYLFSQGQAILTRSWVPTQDSPGIRQTYTARITVPEDLRAVMSAEQLTPDGQRVQGGRAYRFKLDKPVPPYLIAIAVGDLEFRSLGPRSGVYTEPSMLDAAAAELADTEKMITAAESLYGPYRWGRYDLLVLPPSFPYGGMENPRLTFATPTIIAGDRSLTSLVAHELAHSWSGNLVTNAIWADSWLNEGFTTYFENRIMEALYGKERAAMEALLEYRTLQDTIAGLPKGSPRSALKVEASATDPDEGGSAVIYEKGQAFLRTIETTVGRERFDAWLRSYFDRFAFQPMTTEAMLADMRRQPDPRGRRLERAARAEPWVISRAHSREMSSFRSPPPSLPWSARQGWAAGARARSTASLRSWTTQERQHFLSPCQKLSPRSWPSWSRPTPGERGNSESGSTGCSWHQEPLRPGKPRPSASCSAKAAASSSCHLPQLESKASGAAPSPRRSTPGPARAITR
jgi:hypothetical protein